MLESREQPDLTAEREARFWDLQEDRIQELYARPHDWRFVPYLAAIITNPKMRYLRELFLEHRREIDSVLDVGCGNGWFCHMCAEVGIRAWGVDVSSRKVEAARELARQKGLDHLCTFETADVRTFELPEKVSLLSAHGSLHHFPDLEDSLPRMVERFLRPDGLMLFIEPHQEGMPEGLRRLIFGAAGSRWLGRLFDKEHYARVSGGSLGLAEGAQEYDIRAESPAGEEFLGEDPDMGAILESRYALVQKRYFHYLSGHLSNALHVFQKYESMRQLYLLVAPLVARLDTFLCRFPRYQQHAEEGLWLLRPQPPEAPSTKKR